MGHKMVDFGPDFINDNPGKFDTNSRKAGMRQYASVLAILCSYRTPKCSILTCDWINST